MGGGLWFAYLRRGHTVTVAVARSAEQTGFYADGVPLLNREASTRATGALARVLRAFGEVEPGKSATVLLLLANLFVLLVAYYVLKTVREPLVLPTAAPS